VCSNTSTLPIRLHDVMLIQKKAQLEVHLLHTRISRQNKIHVIVKVYVDEYKLLIDKIVKQSDRSLFQDTVPPFA